jgi:hypothetical protein
MVLKVFWMDIEWGVTKLVDFMVLEVDGIVEVTLVKSAFFPAELG